MPNHRVLRRAGQASLNRGHGQLKQAEVGVGGIALFLAHQRGRVVVHQGGPGHSPPVPGVQRPVGALALIKSAASTVESSAAMAVPLGHVRAGGVRGVAADENASTSPPLSRRDEAADATAWMRSRSAIMLTLPGKIPGRVVGPAGGRRCRRGWR